MLISDDILRWASVTYQLVKYDGEPLTVTGSLSKHLQLVLCQYQMRSTYQLVKYDDETLTGSLSKHLQHVAESLNQHLSHHHQIISNGAKGVPLNCKCFLQKCLSNTFYMSCFPNFSNVLHFVLC